MRNAVHLLLNSTRNRTDIELLGSRDLDPPCRPEPFTLQIAKRARTRRHADREHTCQEYGYEPVDSRLQGGNTSNVAT